MASSVVPTKRPRGRIHYEAQRILADLNKKLGLVTTSEQVAEASKWQAKLRDIEADTHKHRAWEAFLHQDKVDSSRVNAEILIHRATGKSSSFFVPEQASGPNLLNGPAVQELNSCLVGIIRLIIEDRLGELDPELPDFRAWQKSPAQCLKRYMVDYKSKKQFQLWNQKWLMDLRRKICSVVYSDAPKKFMDFSASNVKAAIKSEPAEINETLIPTQSDNEDNDSSHLDSLQTPEIRGHIHSREETPEPDFRQDFTLGRSGDLHVPPYVEGQSSLRRLIHETARRARVLRMNIYQKQDALEAARKASWAARKTRLEIPVSEESLKMFQEVMLEDGTVVDEGKKGIEKLSEKAQEKLTRLNGYTKDMVDTIVVFLEPRVKEIIAEKELSEAEKAWERRRDRPQLTTG